MAKERVSHTPGPWTAHKHGPNPWWYVRSASREVAEVELCAIWNDPKRPGTVVEANAHLIAAAPDLLALARKLAGECSECAGTGIIIGTLPSEPCPECADIWAVIRKAEGRS